MEVGRKLQFVQEGVKDRHHLLNEKEDSPSKVSKIISHFPIQFKHLPPLRPYHGDNSSKMVPFKMHLVGTQKN